MDSVQLVADPAAVTTGIHANLLRPPLKSGAPGCPAGTTGKLLVAS
jgi:hypothetical protein